MQSKEQVLRWSVVSGAAFTEERRAEPDSHHGVLAATRSLTVPSGQRVNHFSIITALNPPHASHELGPVILMMSTQSRSLGDT